jgi:hypothetical protein
MTTKPVKIYAKKIEGYQVEFQVFRRDTGRYYCLFRFLDVESCSGGTEGDLDSIEEVLVDADCAAAHKLAEWQHLFPGSFDQRQ